VWFTGQQAGYLGHLDPASGQVTQVPLGNRSAPHGVIVGPDGAAWITDGGLNAIMRVDATTRAVRRYQLPADRPNANLNIVRGAGPSPGHSAPVAGAGSQASASTGRPARSGFGAGIAWVPSTVMITTSSMVAMTPPGKV
jgi:hypothetical protein